MLFVQPVMPIANKPPEAIGLCAGRVFGNPGGTTANGDHSSILVDPFSSLHHQCVAWIFSG